MTLVKTRTARLAAIAEIIGGSKCISTQTELVSALASQGFTVTQSTVAKDLLTLGAIRVRNDAGELCYQLGSQGGAGQTPVAGTERIAKLAKELVISAAGSGNVAIVKVSPGAAEFFASHLDRSGWSEILGTIAGDDTIAVYTATVSGGPKLAEKIRKLSEKEDDE